ncbi:non-specific lipid transfer protein GPI-anchored 20-like [Telopea speciosissima]|uniref:non-specific lipid transfer protein GPI-anchored 20-like n=1 Tax=Telopea speciosissima TaxID=54955 RepID=UPI001CC7E62E|nr:non-specific lipid transfer protein GPI-anchored 20-like [Telopea speciosissima]
MEGLKSFKCFFIAISSIALVMSVIPVLQGQMSRSCTTSMITSFTPCMSYITGSAANGSSPTADCCRSLGTLMNTSMDCACLVVAGNVPLRLPINRTLAVSLPRACNMSGVPVQCKATGSPLPAPGPIAFGPTLSPPASAVPKSTSPALAPQAELPTGLTPASTPVSSETPASSGIRPVLSPSAANPSESFSPSLLLFAVGVLALKYY